MQLLNRVARLFPPFCTFLVFLLIVPLQGFADNATVLPDGFWQVVNETAFFVPVDEQYDEDGDSVRIDAPFNVPLAGIVPGLPFGSDIGRSDVDIELNQTETQFTFAYGLTDRLSVGVIVPWLEQSTDVGAAINSSTANRGKNALIASPTNPLGIGFPCAALGCASGADIGAGTTPVNLVDVQALLGANGFQELDDWQESGFGDIDLGGRYQYYRSDMFRGAFTGGVRFPVGEMDDPDNLVDRGFGTGAFGLLFQFQQDLLFQRQGAGIGGRLGFPSPGSFFLNTDFRYEVMLPDAHTFRVCPPTAPICATKANLNRNLGDNIHARVAPTIGLLKGVILTSEYRFRHKFKDSFDGPSGIDVGVLEKDSDLQQHEIKFILSFTTIPWVVEKKFPLPLVVAFTFRDRFAGYNTFNTKFFGFNLTLYGK